MCGKHMRLTPVGSPLPGEVCFLGPSKGSPPAGSLELNHSFGRAQPLENGLSFPSLSLSPPVLPPFPLALHTALGLRVLFPTCTCVSVKMWQLGSERADLLRWGPAVGSLGRLHLLPSVWLPFTGTGQQRGFSTGVGTGSGWFDPHLAPDLPEATVPPGPEVGELCGSYTHPDTHGHEEV